MFPKLYKFASVCNHVFGTIYICSIYAQPLHMRIPVTLRLGESAFSFVEFVPVRRLQRKTWLNFCYSRFLIHAALIVRILLFTATCLALKQVQCSVVFTPLSSLFQIFGADMSVWVQDRKIRRQPDAYCVCQEELPLVLHSLFAFSDEESNLLVASLPLRTLYLL